MVAPAPVVGVAVAGQLGDHHTSTADASRRVLGMRMRSMCAVLVKLVEFIKFEFPLLFRSYFDHIEAVVHVQLGLGGLRETTLQLLHHSRSLSRIIYAIEFNSVELQLLGKELCKCFLRFKLLAWRTLYSLKLGKQSSYSTHCSIFLYLY